MILEKDADGNDHVLIRQSWWGTFTECNERGRLAIIDPDADGEGDAAAAGTAAHAAIEECINGTIAPSELKANAELHAHRLLDTLNIEFKSFDHWQDLVSWAGKCAEAWGRDIWPKLPKGGRTEVPFKVRDLTRVDGVRVGITGTIDLVLPNDLRDWKGLALDTPLPTPSGWTTMGEVQVGDSLLGASGLPVEVIGKSEVKYDDCYRVTFRDGESIVTDSVHLWEVHDGNNVRSVVSTPELRERGPKGRPHHIRAPKPVKLPEVDLPMDPYIFGYWLGDGTTGKAEFTVGSDDLDIFLVRLAQAGYPSSVRHARDRASTIVVTHNLKNDLADMGVLHTKEIPSIFMRGSIDQRLAFLRGLMDSDGNWNRTRQRCSFDNVRFWITDAVAELAASFGWSYSTHVGSPRGFQNAKPYRRVDFTPVGLNPFLLARKAALPPAQAPVQSSRRYIESVERIPTVPTQCVAVAADDHLFLAGRSMTPTHNTSARRYDEKKYQKNAHQPTFYSIAAVEGGLDVPWQYTWPMPFTYGVMVRNVKPICQQFTVVRTEAHAAWLMHRIEQAVRMMLTLGLEKEWPTNDTSFLCSDRWCPWWDGCKGKYLSWHDDKLNVG